MEQYLSLCQVTRLGIVGKRYIYQGDRHLLSIIAIIQVISYHVVYREQGYLQAVEKVADRSMNDAVEEVKKGEDYARSGEVDYT